jgi:hypothetical protein
MLKIKHSFILLSAILLTTITFASKEYPFQKGVVRHRFSLAPVVCFYKNHDQHTINTKANLGFCMSYKAEIFSGKKANLILGLEFLNEAFTFQGYYATPGKTIAFDRTYPYTHTSRIQEIGLPIGIKLALMSEEGYYFTPYYLGGFCPRYILGSYNLIVNDVSGVTMHEGKGDIDFEHSIISSVKQLNGFVFSGIGGQYNFRGSAKAVFFEVMYKYGLSRFNYHGYQDSNNLFIKNSNLAFSFGVRF